MKVSKSTLGWVALGFSTSFILVAFLKRKEIMKMASDLTDYVLDKQNKPYVEDLNPATKVLFAEFLKGIYDLGYGVIITSGVRDYDKTKELLKANPSNAKLSYHNFGFALDMNLFKGGKYWRKATSKEDWEKTGVPQLARKLGLKWGGDFNSYHDPVHFDARNIASISKLRKLGEAKYGTDTKKMMDNGNTIQIT